MEKRIKRIADHYKYDAQSRQCIEEMGELTQAINKFWRTELQCGKKNIFEVPIASPNLRSIQEEIADVQIMLWQLCYLLDLDIESTVDYKLDRQIERIDKGCLN